MKLLTQCPDRGQLQALSRGELDAEAQDDLCRHLSDCPKCESDLAALEDEGDGIVSNLRRFLNREPWIKREEFKRLEARAQAIPIERLDAVAVDAASSDEEQPTKQEDKVPQRLGKYELVRELGRGGMGIVYVAVHTQLNRQVAVKVMRPEHSDDPQVRARFRREMKAIGELVHTNIVAATDAGESNGRHFLVMELLDGLDVEALAKLIGPMPVAESCEIIRQAAVGLQYVHLHNRVHRDLKPSNLMLSADGVVKILDLGLARLFADHAQSDEVSRSNLAMGTADYMAPEQWEDSRKVDIRADIYSLGCTLYRLLVGEVPYFGPEYKADVKKKAAHRHQPLPEIRVRRTDVPEALARVLEKMLAKNPAARFTIPQDLAEAIAPFSAGGDCRKLLATARQRQAGFVPGSRGIGGPREETVASPRETPGGGAQVPVNGRTKKASRKRGPLVAAAVLLLAACAVLVVSFSGGWGGSRPLQPGVSQKLLQEMPAAVKWDSARFHLTKSFARERNEIAVDVPSVGLLGLGSTEYAGYRIQLGIKQTRWTGGVGFFFGYRESTHDGHRCIKYQLLEVNKYKNGFNLCRSNETIYPNRDDMGSDGLSDASEFLGTLVDADQYTLIIEVTRKGLTLVTWNGKPLPNLVKPETNGRFTEIDYIGQFGTFNLKSNSVFGNSYVMLFERNSP